MDKYNGLSRDKAECFGKPHINAWYTGNGESVDKYTFDHQAIDIITHQQPTNTHHIVPRGTARFITIPSQYGVFVLKTALIAVRGSGTWGVHGAFHRHEIKMTWEWDSPEYEEQWWNGYLLSHGYPPHSKELYKLGRWVIDVRGAIIEYRGEHG